MIPVQPIFYRPLLTAAALSFLLSGCANIPNLEKLFTPNSMSFYETSKSFQAKKETSWPGETWWTDYNDPQLAALIEQGLENSPDLGQASARVHQAEAIAEQAGSALYPDLTGNASLQKVKQSYYNGAPVDFVPHGFKDSARATIDLNYQLDFWGKNRKALASAVSEVEAAKLEQTQAKLTLSTSIAETYASLVQYYAELEAAQDALDVRGQTAKLYKERYDNGLENVGTYDQQIAAQSNAEAEIEALNESIALTKNRLAALTGAGPDRALDIGKPKTAKIKSFGLPKNLPAELLGRRPDIRAALYRTQAAAKRIDVARTEFYPNVDLAAYFGQQSLGLDLFTKKGSFIGAFGPAITLPLFDSGRIAGNYKSARGDYELSVAQYNGIIVKALNEVADAAVSEKALSARTAKIQKAASASERAYNVALQRYKGGLATNLDVLRAEDSLIVSRRALADIHARAFLLDVQMISALGGGFQDKNEK